MPNNNPQSPTSQPQITREIARASEAVNRAGERLEANAENAASVAIEKVRQVRDQAQSGLEQQRVEVVERIRRVGDALRSGSESLARADPLSQQLFDTASDRIERVAGYIETLTPGDLASDVADVSRRRPGLFFGGAFLIGLAVGRFAKSSTDKLGGERTRRTQPRGHSALRTAAPRTAPSSQARPAANVSSPLPQGVSSSAPAAPSASHGSAHAGSSYGASPGLTGKAAPSSTPSSTAHEVLPGEGSKS